MNWIGLMTQSAKTYTCITFRLSIQVLGYKMNQTKNNVETLSASKSFRRGPKY